MTEAECLNRCATLNFDDYGDIVMCTAASIYTFEGQEYCTTYFWDSDVTGTSPMEAAPGWLGTRFGVTVTDVTSYAFCSAYVEPE